LEFSRDVAAAPLHVASLGRRRLRAPAPFAASSIGDHVPTLVGKYVLEIAVLFWFGARHDEEKVWHDPPSARFESPAHSIMEAPENAGCSWRRLRASPSCTRI